METLIELVKEHPVLMVTGFFVGWFLASVIFGCVAGWFIHKYGHVNHEEDEIYKAAKRAFEEG